MVSFVYVCIYTRIFHLSRLSQTDNPLISRNVEKQQTARLVHVEMAGKEYGVPGVQSQGSNLVLVRDSSLCWTHDWEGASYVQFS
jgi:hypothetical protein